MKKLSFFNKIIFTINTILAIVLLFSYTTPYVKPSSIAMIPFLSLIVPVLILVNILFVIYWILIGFKRQYIVSLFILIIGLFTVPSIYKFDSSSSSTSSEEELSIMTYNVRKFNKYKWIKSESLNSEITTFIENEKPDILALQEYQNFENFKLQYKYYSNPLNNNYSDPERNKKFKSNLAIFSKYPIINDGIIKYDNFLHSIIYADIVKNSDTIRVYTFHLASLGVIPDQEYFGHQDSKKLIKRLSNSFKTQEVQINSFKNHIKNCKYKVIVAGDMNNTAYSWGYRNIKEDLQDSFLEAGKGFGRSYNFKGYPLRIDYVFVDREITILKHKNYGDRYSDHYPVMATVSF